MLGVAAEARHLLNPDAAWLVYSAERMLRGERLYRDILEINPPLILWLNLPVAATARLLHLSAIPVFRVAVVVLAMGSILASAWVLRQGDPRRSRWLVVPICLGLFVLPGGMFGQREHLAIALLLPLIFLTALRVRETPIGRPQALLPGVMGALGLALKPHYAAVWLGLVAYRAWARAPRRLRWYPEDSVVVAAGIAYPLLVAWLTPEYFALAVSAARDYMAFGSQPIGRILFDDSPAILFYVAAAVWLVTLRRGAPMPELGALAWAGAGFVVAVALQHKGWSYHYLPLLVCALLLASGTAAELLEARRSPTTIAYAALVAACAAVPVVAAVGRVLGQLDEREVRQRAAIEAVHAQRGAQTILVLSSQLRDAFPTVNESGMRWTGGYPTMWFPLVYYRSYAGPSSATAYRAPSGMPPGERAAFERVVRDVVQGRPDLLVVESRGLNERRTRFPGGFDYRTYFGQDSGFAAALGAYHQVGDVQGLDLLRREAGR